MKSGGGKQKGSSFERKICEYLSLWITNNEHKDVFWRSAMSGGRATVHLNAGIRMTAQAGDISAIRGIGEQLLNVFLIECKFYKDLKFDSLLFDSKQGISGFWEKLVKDSAKFDRYPLLIARQNNKPVLIGTNSFIISSVQAIAQKKFKTQSVFTHLNLTLVLMDEFFETLKPEMLQLLKTKKREKNKLKE